MKYPKALTERYLTIFDEINRLFPSVMYDKPEQKFGDFLIWAYMEGSIAAAYMLNSDDVSMDESVLDGLMDYIYPGDDETIGDKAGKYINGDEIMSLLRLWESETHRVYVQGLMDKAKELKATKKTWCTMLDDKVRDAHIPLEGVTIDMDDDFYIGDDHAPAPGLFELIENNANCRCVLYIQK